MNSRVSALIAIASFAAVALVVVLLMSEPPDPAEPAATDPSPTRAASHTDASSVPPLQESSTPASEPRDPALAADTSSAAVHMNPATLPPERSDEDDQADAAVAAQLAADVEAAVAAAISQGRQQRMTNVRDVIIAAFVLIDRNNNDWPQDAAAFAEMQAVGSMLSVIQGRGSESNNIAQKLAALPTLVYRRPPYGIDHPDFNPQWVIFHELVGKTFPETGIAVGFADGHIEWITDEDAFEALLNPDQDG